MKTARQVFHAAMRDGNARAKAYPGSVVGCSDVTDWHSSYCDAGTAAIEADRQEMVEACANEADPACNCESDPPRHDECKGARDAMRRIRALIPKEDSRAR